MESVMESVMAVMEHIGKFEMGLQIPGNFVEILNRVQYQLGWLAGLEANMALDFKLNWLNRLHSQLQDQVRLL